jgi:hypothetical protein
MPAYPLIEFLLRVGAWDVVDEILPDTGYDGAVIVPAGVGREIASEPEIGELPLAGGEVHRALMWDGMISIENHEFPVRVPAFGSEHVLGRWVLDQFKICFEYGRRVRLEFGGE